MGRSPSATRVRLPRECFIPVAKHRLVDSLLGQLESPGQEGFAAFCRMIEAIYHFEFHDTASQLKQDFALLHDDQPQQQAPPSDEELLRAERRFLDNFLTMMEKGNFRLLTQDDIDVAEEEDYLFHLPVKVDWNKLDQEMLSRYFADRRYADGARPPQFADRILIFQRGVGIDRTEGFHFIQKLDLIVTQLLEGAWRLLTRPLDLIRSGTPTTRSDDPPQDRQAHAPRQSEESDRFVDRITLRSTGVGLGALLRKTAIQEPTFDELILLYRLDASASGKETPDHESRAVHIKAFRGIPMADLEVVFPEKRISMQPVDLVKLVITGTVGLVVVATKLIFASVFNPVMAAAALATIAGYAAKVFMGFKVSRDRYQHLVTQSLYHKNQDNDLGVIFYLMDSLEDQEFKEAVLAYYFLWQQGELSEAELDRRCEAHLKQQFGADVDFEVDDALRKLHREGLITSHAGRFRACPIDEALQRLDHKWDNYFQFNAAGEQAPESAGPRVLPHPGVTDRRESGTAEAA